MLTNVYVQYRSSRSTVTIDTPNTCPHCGGKMSPEVLGAYSEYEPNESNKVIGVLAECTNDSCWKYFALSYIYEYRESKGYSHYLIPYTYKPEIEVNLPKNIEKLSPSFVEIYKQATKAEQDKLDHIAGVGYRKSAEYLFKDFAIFRNPDDKVKVEKMTLMNVINTYLQDLDEIKNLAKSVAWLGNDETHYVRKHTDKDLEDLKEFLDAAALLISGKYTAIKAMNFISGS